MSEVRQHRRALVPRQGDWGPRAPHLRLAAAPLLGVWLARVPTAPLLPLPARLGPDAPARVAPLARASRTGPSSTASSERARCAARPAPQPQAPDQVAAGHGGPGAADGARARRHGGVDGLFLRWL